MLLDIFFLRICHFLPGGISASFMWTSMGRRLIEGYTGDWTPGLDSPGLDSDIAIRCSQTVLTLGVKHHKLCPVSYNCHCLGCCPRLVCPPDISIPKWTSLEITNSVGWSEEDDARGDCQSAR